MSTSKQYANVYVKTTFTGPRSIAGVSSSQALSGFLITAPPPVFIPAVLGALPGWIQKPKKIILIIKNQKPKSSGSVTT